MFVTRQCAKSKKTAWIDRNKNSSQPEGERCEKECSVDAEKWNFVIRPLLFYFMRKVESASLSRGNAQKVKKAAWMDRNKKLTQSEGEGGGKECSVDAEKWNF
jgi:hypothetical protein